MTLFFQIGKAGLSENLLKQLDDAIEARELIKINVLESSGEDVKALGNEIADSINAICVQTMGNKITLYRARKKKSDYIIRLNTIIFYSIFLQFLLTHASNRVIIIFVTETILIGSVAQLDRAQAF